MALTTHHEQKRWLPSLLWSRHDRNAVKRRYRYGCAVAVPGLSLVRRCRYCRGQRATVAWRLPGAPITRPITIDQTPAGIAQLLSRLQATGIAPGDTLVVLEATGSYWITLATDPAPAGYAVSVINPMQAHHFAKALLKRAKTDAIDAQTLTQLAAQLQPAALDTTAGGLL